MSLRMIVRALLVSAGIALCSGAAAGDHVNVRLISAVRGTGQLATVPLGLDIRLEGEWKTYWRSPGEAGLPPTLDWAGSANLKRAELLYPAPQRLSVLGIESFGYKHEAVLPIDATLGSIGHPLNARLKLDLLICAEQCIPRHFDLALNVPAGPAQPSDDAQMLAKARASLPGDSRTSGLNVDSAQEVSDHGMPALEVKVRSDRRLSNPDVIAELSPDIAFAAPRHGVSAGGREADFVIPLARPLPVGARLTGRDVRLTVTDGDRALDALRAIAQSASATEEDAGPSLVQMVFVALLGGLILNLMPCVLPVLSLKLLAAVAQGGRAPRAVRAGFLASAAGIVASFLAIALALIALRAAGRSVGWGIQFQEPAFIAGMAVLVTVFACHLAGFFEVPLPRFVAAAASNRTGPDEHLLGHFVTGAFATLLATPCSAPFLGTAVGFALAGRPADMLAIFLALGLGLALPYLLVAAMPRLATRLPRPGRWMLLLRQAMAVPLAATAVWLLFVLANQVGVGPAFMVALLLVVVAGLLFWRERMAVARRRYVFPLVTLVALCAIVLPDLIAAHVAEDESSDSTIAWTRFDRDSIRSLVSQGKTIFVDVTADWCLTCKANSRFVLSSADVARRLNSEAVPMKADWTRPNAEIGDYLASYGRYGIPFNAVYGPGAPSGIVLPELLTPHDVDEALDKASKLKATAIETRATTPRT